MFFGRLVRLLLSLLFLTLSTCVCAAPHTVASAAQHTLADKIQISGISDAGKVNEFLYRGAQPNEEGLRQLKRLGIDTIVDLRGEKGGAMEKERSRTETMGIHLINIAGNGWSPPQDEQIAQFLSLILKKPRQRIFVHCRFGGDRSGVFIAVYRIAFDGWTPEEALWEMRAFHFNGFWHPAMKAYVRDFPARLVRSAVLAPFRQARVAKTQ
jgi:protein tyrosine/serine phosphatase